MNLTYCNTTRAYEEIKEVPLFSNWTFHYLGLWISAGFGLIATLSSLYLMWMHATHYSRPWEQKHIIRILFMVPIYSVVSFLSYRYYLHAIYFAVLRDTYEAFAIASFFALLCHYVAPTLHDQKNYFRELKDIRPWVWPLSWMRKCCGGERGCLRTPRSGLTWFNIIWFCVFQYCFVRVFATFLALGTQAAGRYCQESLSPAFAHVWVIVIEGTCVSIAMFCLIQFYIQLRTSPTVAAHSPFIKVLAIKLVIFLSFWQTIAISLLTSSGAIKESVRIATPDLQIGIPAMLLCIEMACFSILHLWAYPWRIYASSHVNNNIQHFASSGEDPSLHLDGVGKSYKGGRFGIMAFLDAFNPWDLVKAIGRGFRWAVVGRKHREKDISYHPHLPHHHSSPTNPTYRPTKPGKYTPLSDTDSDSHVPFVQNARPHSFMESHPHPQTFAEPQPPPRSFPEARIQQQTALSKPIDSSRGDLGTMRVVERGEEGGEEFRARGPMPSGRTAYAPPTAGEDTGYYGPQGREEWVDPRRKWGGGEGGQF